jgi:hypothetical protein
MEPEARRKAIEAILDECEQEFFSSFPNAQAARIHAKAKWDPKKPVTGDYEAFVATLP